MTGAPYVALEGVVAPWEISLSDRAGCVVAVIGASGSGAGALGIDLEVVEPRSEGFVTDFLTRAEQDWVRGPGCGRPRARSGRGREPGAVGKGGGAQGAAPGASRGHPLGGDHRGSDLLDDGGHGSPQPGTAARS